MKKLLALVLALAMVMMVSAAFAASITITAASDTAEANTDTAKYTWYRILEAEIEEDPTSNDPDQEGGKVAYYTDSAAKVTELEKTNLFNIVRVGETDKWFVELKSDSTTGAAIAEAIGQIDLSKFPTGNFAQETVGGEAESGTVAPGYYYITSTVGNNIVLQTLSDVEVKEKNEYPPVEKEVDNTDKNAQIGDEITYTLTVTVPGTANDTIVLTDTMTEGLTFKSIDSVKAGEDDVAYTAAPDTAAAVTTNDNTFTITFDAATVQANQGKTIEITYTAILNNKATVASPEKNTVTLKYGNNYESKPKETETKTYDFNFEKVDGTTKEALTGAEFELQLNGTALALVELEAGKSYRIATSEDTTTTTTITTNGNKVNIYGLDTDVTYTLKETKAPTGYNIVNEKIEVKAEDNAFVDQQVENNKGSVLPSTGGIGTTIFYVVGGLLIIGAAVILVARRKAHE